MESLNKTLSLQRCPPIYFVSFASNKYASTLERIRKQAHDFGIFEQIYCLSESDIEQTFWDKHADFIVKNPRGHGCWIWKSYVVKKILNQIPENSILLYCDAGCSLFKEGMSRFNMYINYLMKSKYSNISFQMDIPEIKYTRNNIFNEFEYENKLSGQLVGGIFFLRKNEYTISLVDLWYDKCQNYNLIGDVSDESMKLEHPEFIENRHDQSIFSIIRKKYGTTTIKDETYFGENFNNFRKFPIHATRLKY